MAAVNFYLDTHPNKAGECPVKMSVIIRKKRFFPTIGHSVSPDVWKNGRVSRQKYENSKGTLATKINQDILDLQSHFTRYAVEVDHIPTPEEFKAEMRKALGKSDPTAKTSTAPKARTIFDDIDQFVQEEGVACQWATSTIQNWETFKKRLHRFNPGIKYSDFNEEGLTKFVNFLRTKDHLEENTTQKQFNNLKWFLNWAIRKGYCSESQINRYRPKFRILEKPVIFLTKEELLTLYRYDIPANGTKVTLTGPDGTPYEKTVREAGALAKTRDLFCFCAFTSLRYSDMAQSPAAASTSPHRRPTTDYP